LIRIKLNFGNFSQFPDTNLFFSRFAGKLFAKIIGPFFGMAFLLSLFVRVRPYGFGPSG